MANSILFIPKKILIDQLIRMSNDVIISHLLRTIGAPGTTLGNRRNLQKFALVAFVGGRRY